MLELARELLPLVRGGVPVAIVTVTRVDRSAPRGVGASMAVTADGRVIGSISGGCVEGDAVVLAHTARVTGAPQSARLGFSDDAAHAAGLACGGSVDVVAYPAPTDPASLEALEHAAAGRRTTLALPGTGVVLSLDPAPQLVIVGAGEHAAALCRVAAAARFSVTVIDVWETLVTRERFPDAAHLVAGLPHEHLLDLDLDERSAVCVLSHDERVDVPALEAALRTPAGFVGAMGARSTVARRTELLRERGVSGADLARLHSPLGLDLGGSTPEETAIAALAEIVASRHDGSGRALRELGGPLHRRVAGATPEDGAPVGASASPPPTFERTSDVAYATSCTPHPTGATP
ncbi:MAG: XdhC family protein [Microbacterium sp.]